MRGHGVKDDGDHPSLSYRAWGPDGPPQRTSFPAVSFFNQNPRLFAVLAVVLGLASGLITDFLVFKEEESPSSSFGPFVFPAVILGAIASTGTRAAGIGLSVQLFTVLGHFLGAQFTGYDPDSPEYQYWLALALLLGPLLGYLGYLVRSRWKAARSVAAGLTVGLIICPFFFWGEGGYFVDNMTAFTIVFDMASILVILTLCRGLVVRGAAVAISAFLCWGLPLFPMLVLILTLSLGGPV